MNGSGKENVIEYDSALLRFSSMVRRGNLLIQSYLDLIMIKSERDSFMSDNDRTGHVREYRIWI